MRRISRRPAKHKEEQAGGADILRIYPSTQNDVQMKAKHKEEKGASGDVLRIYPSTQSDVQTNKTKQSEENENASRPRTILRTRSHSLTRPFRRNKGETTDSLNSEPRQLKGRNKSRQKSPSLSTRSSTEWKEVTSELHRRMKATEEKPFKGGAPPRFEISPAARSILMKKEQQRRRDHSKTSSSHRSGKSRNTFTTQGSSFVSEERSGKQRMPSRPISSAPTSRRQNTLLNDQKEPTTSWTEASLANASDSRAPAVDRGTLEIHEVSKNSDNHNENPDQQEPASPSVVGPPSSVDSKRGHGKSHSRRLPNDTTSKSMISPSGPGKNGISNEATNRPKIRKTNLAETMDRSVASKVSSVPSSSQTNRNKLPLKKNRRNHSTFQTVPISLDSVKTILTDRMAMISNDPKERDTPLKEQQVMDDQSNDDSSSFWLWQCTNPMSVGQDIRRHPNLTPAEARKIRHKEWIEYAVRSISHAKHGSGNPQVPHIVSPTYGRGSVAAAPGVIGLQRSEDDEHEKEEDDETTDDEDEIRSISSVDLLVRWIGGCGEPDLSDHYPPTQREQLALHQAARTPRGCPSSSRQRR